VTDEDFIGPVQFILTLPFPHRFDSRELAASGPAVSAGWEHWFCRVPYEETPLLFDYSYFFVPHVRRLLFPELLGWEGKEQSAPKLSAGMSVAQVRSEFGAVDRDRYVETALRLTFTSPRPWLKAPLTLGQGSEAIGFTVAWVDALLLPQHAGVLMIKVLISQPVTVDQLAYFARRIKKRAFRRRYTVDVEPFRYPDNESVDWQTILDDLLGGIRSEDDRWGGAEVVETLGTHFRYVGVAGTHVERSEPPRPFASDLERVLFGVATGHSARNEVDSFSGDALVELRRSRMLNMWDNKRIVAYDHSLGVAVLRGNAILDRNLHTTLEMCEWAFVLMQALLLGQQMRLHLLAADIQKTPTSLDTAIEHLEDVERNAVVFRRIHWVEQVTANDMGERLFDLMRVDMRIREMSRFLDDELGAVRARVMGESQRAEKRASERTTRLIELLTFVGVPLGLLVTAFDQFIPAYVVAKLGTNPPVMTILAVSAAFLLIAYMVVRFIGRWGRNRTDLSSGAVLRRMSVHRRRR
jgi:hypothetical protein